MTQYEVFDSSVEVHGRTILAIVDEALARFSESYRKSARETLAANGVENPSSDEWYPQQIWLDTFETISNDLQSHLLDRLGEQVPDVVDWPNNISSVPEGLKSIDEAYDVNHRGGEIGHYRFTEVDDQTGKMVCKNPYPCYFDRGLIRAVAQRYAPVQSFVFVEEAGDRCRRRGDYTCTYFVYW